MQNVWMIVAVVVLLVIVVIAIATATSCQQKKVNEKRMKKKEVPRTHGQLRLVGVHTIPQVPATTLSEQAAPRATIGIRPMQTPKDADTDKILRRYAGIDRELFTEIERHLGTFNDFQVTKDVDGEPQNVTEKEGLEPGMTIRGFEAYEVNERGDCTFPACDELYKIHPFPYDGDGVIGTIPYNTSIYEMEGVASYFEKITLEIGSLRPDWDYENRRYWIAKWILVQRLIHLVRVLNEKRARTTEEMRLLKNLIRIILANDKQYLLQIEMGRGRFRTGDAFTKLRSYLRFLIERAITGNESEVEIAALFRSIENTSQVEGMSDALQIFDRHLVSVVDGKDMAEKGEPWTKSLLALRIQEQARDIPSKTPKSAFATPAATPKERGTGTEYVTPLTEDMPDLISFD